MQPTKPSPLSKEALVAYGVGLALLAAIAAMVIIGLKNDEIPVRGDIHAIAEPVREVRTSEKAQGGPAPVEEIRESPSPR